MPVNHRVKIKHDEPVKIRDELVFWRDKRYNLFQSTEQASRADAERTGLPGKNQHYPGTIHIYYDASKLGAHLIQVEFLHFSATLRLCGKKINKLTAKAERRKEKNTIPIW